MEPQRLRGSFWKQQVAARRGGAALIQLPPGGFGGTEILVPQLDIIIALCSLSANMAILVLLASAVVPGLSSHAAI